MFSGGILEGKSTRALFKDFISTCSSDFKNHIRFRLRKTHPYISFMIFFQNALEPTVLHARKAHNIQSIKNNSPSGENDRMSNYWTTAFMLLHSINV